MNDDVTLREIENALSGVDGLDWIGVEDADLVASRGSPYRLYRLTLPPDALACPDVRHLELAIPSRFPYEQPTVYAPGAGTTVPWPHVEPDYKLCLVASRFDIDPGTRVLETLQWAVNLLNQDEETRREEFDREFRSYWPSLPEGLHVLSLVTLDGPSRAVSWCTDAGIGRFVVADDETTLRRWMQRAERTPRANAVHDGAYVRLTKLPRPGTYPQTGGRLEEIIRVSGAPLPPLHVAARVPVLLGMPTVAGTLAVAAIVQHGGAEVTKRFRARARVRATRALWTSAANRPVSRRSVDRMDGHWIHGRDHDPDHETLRARSVGVVGCGSLGSCVVRLLAQAGVGRFVFVDADMLHAENLSRHALDHPFLGTFKADGMHRWFERAFPHADGAEAFTRRWERLDDDELETLSGVDLLLTAGLPVETELLVDRWRGSAATPPARLSAWVEPFALAGHAVALFGPDTLAHGLHSDGSARFAITRWPASVPIKVLEAGCGSAFQPHAAATLQHTAALCAELALDVLCGRVTASRRRAWHASAPDIRKQGGQPIDPGLDHAGVLDAAWL